MRRVLSLIVAGGLAGGVLVGASGPAWGQSADLAAFCQARIDINQAETEEENLDGLDDLVATAPPDVSAQVTQLRDDFAENGFEAYESDVVAQLDEYIFASCPGAEVEVSAIDYEFVGVPDSLPAGVTKFKMTNDAPEEDHEMGIVRLTAKGERKKLEKLLRMPEKKLGRFLDFSGSTGMFAPAGGTGYTIADLQPGTYVYACFVPVGGKEKGAPHFTEGMYGSFTVQ